MTLEMQEMLEREMDDALSLEDAARRADAVQTVTLHYLRALTDCNRKTAERVKELVAEREANKNRVAGVKLFYGILKAAISIAGPTGAIVLCKLTGILW